MISKIISNKLFSNRLKTASGLYLFLLLFSPTWLFIVFSIIFFIGFPNINVGIFLTYIFILSQYFILYAWLAFMVNKIANHTTYKKELVILKIDGYLKFAKILPDFCTAFFIFFIISNYLSPSSNGTYISLVNQVWQGLLLVTGYSIYYGLYKLMQIMSLVKKRQIIKLKNEVIIILPFPITISLMQKEVRNTFNILENRPVEPYKAIYF